MVNLLVDHSLIESWGILLLNTFDDGMDKNLIQYVARTFLLFRRQLCQWYDFNNRLNRS